MVLVATLLGLSLDHGLPHRYVPDDTVVRCALGMARDVADGGGAAALVPPGAAYTTYPYLLPYLDLGAMGVRYAVGRATGEWRGAGAFAEAVFANPGLAWLPGRIVSVLLALLLPLGVYRAARELRRSKNEAALAALMAGTSLMVVQFAHTVRPWAPMLGFAAVALALGLRLQRKRRVRDVALAFLAAGLAGATFQVGLAYLAVPVVAWGVTLAGAGSGDSAEGRVASRGRLLAGLAVGVVVTGLVLAVLGYPYKWVHGADSGAGFQTGESALLSEADGGVIDIGGQAFGLTMLGGARFATVLRSWLGYDPVLALAGLAGLLLWARCRVGRASNLLLVVVPGVLCCALFLAYDGSHVRYMMIGVPFLALGAGRLLSALARRGAGARVVACVLLAVPIVQAARLDMLLAREDTRTLAARELLEIIGTDELAAVDGLGSQYGPPLVPRAETLVAMMEDQAARAVGPEQQGLVWLSRSEQRLVAEAEAGLPTSPDARHLLSPQRYWRYISYYPTDFLFGEPGESTSLVEWMTEWGVDVYVRVDRAPVTEPRAPIDAFTAEYGELVYERSPTGGTDPLEAALPTDMDFALTQLWTYERPGPWIRAWRLDTGRAASRGGAPPEPRR
jgi:hypothetical protein